MKANTRFWLYTVGYILAGAAVIVIAALVATDKVTMDQIELFFLAATTIVGGIGNLIASRRVTPDAPPDV